MIVKKKGAAERMGWGWHEVPLHEHLLYVSCAAQSLQNMSIWLMCGHLYIIMYLYCIVYIIIIYNTYDIFYTRRHWPLVVQYRFVLSELRVAHGLGVLVLVVVVLDSRFARHSGPRMVRTPLEPDGDAQQQQFGQHRTSHDVIF